MRLRRVFEERRVEEDGAAERLEERALQPARLGERGGLVAVTTDLLDDVIRRKGEILRCFFSLNCSSYQH